MHLRAIKQQTLFAEDAGKTERAAKLEVVRVEKHLTTIGFLRHLVKILLGISSKNVKIQIRSSTGQKVEARATIFPSAEFGLPTTSDQDKYFAFQQLIERSRGADGVITNPVHFTSASMLEILGMTQGARTTRTSPSGYAG